ncbi:fumarylacetoacetate hydrolase family protein [uncultured Sphingomonas sp.]|uniref:fumarylacetoacetate hydrolase family protein n=1 Tax=uncultured Sphingomonas sp. TaxID=158754 RepID=UPI00263657CF|nr:fumarylacetoacetate hydrolase family protein [uncultured Sphingomonas sp.]
MKLVTFAYADGRHHIGALRAGEREIVDFTASGEAMFADMLSLIDGHDAALDRAHVLLRRAEAVVEARAVGLLSPVPEPRSILDCLCFEEHLMNAGRYAHVVTNGPPLVNKADGPPPIYRELPVYYKGNRFSVVGANADIVCPRYSRFLDYELEFGVFLGRRGRNWTVDEAEDAIFGYAIFNDVTARDRQMREMRGMLGPAKGKDFDTGNVIGPWLVTKDEVPVGRGLRMRAWINGDLVTDGSSAAMMHSFPEIIAYASEDETRQPGEFIGSGTVGGGCALEHGRFLQRGDILELEVEGLGRQRNRIVFQDTAA